MFLSLGLPHTQGVQGNSGNFDSFFNSGKLRGILVFSKNFREILRFKKKSQGIFFSRSTMRFS